MDNTLGTEVSRACELRPPCICGLLRRTRVNLQGMPSCSRCPADCVFEITLVTPHTHQVGEPVVGTMVYCQPCLWRAGIILRHGGNSSAGFLLF